MTRLKSSYDGMLGWIADNTSADAVIAAPHGSGLRIDLALLARRPAFHGIGQPFRTACLAENAQRGALIAGLSADSNTGGPRYRDYYRALDYADFQSIARAFRLDYVLIDEDHQPDMPAETIMQSRGGLRLIMIDPK